MAIDLFFATLSQYSKDSLNNRNWSFPLAMSHSVLPAIFFIALWTFGNNWPNAVIGGIGFSLIFLLIYEVFMEEIGKEPVFSLTDSLTWLLNSFKVSRGAVRHFLFIMSVSWDIVLGTPSIIPIVKSNEWGVWQIVGIFVISGLFAGVAATVALSITSSWRERQFSKWQDLAKRKIKGTYFALTAIGAFCLTALAYAFSVEVNFIFMFPVSALLLLVLFYVYRGELWSEAREYSLEVMDGQKV